MEMKRLFRYVTSEAVLWSIGLLALYFMGRGEVSVCMFRWLGFERCWGCGLGHAVHDALHLDLASSFAHHPMGLLVLVVLLMRIFNLVRQTTKTKRHVTARIDDDASRTKAR